MKLLFINGGSRVRISNNGKYYTDSNFNQSIWDRYISYCDELTVVLRKINNIYNDEDIKEKFNQIDVNKLNLKLVDDIYTPRRLNINKRRNIDKIIEEEVKNADKVIIRSYGNFYTNTALKYCKKHNKDYMIEITGFYFDNLWYHSLFGKIVALPRELSVKKAVKSAKYVSYVTEEALQKRYKCDGNILGCSDVEIGNLDDNVLQKRLEKINSMKDIKKDKIIIGTAAFLDVKYKGQQGILKALNKLKKEGINNLEYQLIGSGSGKLLKKSIKKYGLEENVKIIGSKSHREVFEWLDSIDIYVHPSYTEGLCRSIVEAMSRGCLVICSDVGGNYELIDRKYLYSKKNIKQFICIIKSVDKEQLIEQSKKNFEKAKKFQKDKLDAKRDDFYKMFISDKE